ncbi:MAG: glycosyltransferase [Verrucomicrobiales bacterium]|nr:glycosyltransferase [Verrucomicrobiales bacterium]
MVKSYAVIIPAYNEEALLGTTIATIRRAMNSIGAEGELIVVDNNSTDATAEIARQAGADRVVFEAHNQIAKARNAGARVSKAEWLVFVDADTQVPEKTLQKALELLREGKVAGGGARLVMDQPVSRIVGYIVKGWEQFSEKLGYAAGSFFFCRRDAFLDAGGFEEAVYAGEEVWLARKIKRWGKKRGLPFKIIEEPPVETSGRKSNWFSTRAFILQIAVLLLFPWAARSRRLCSLWYQRPAG